MMLKRKSSQSKSSTWSLLRAGVAGLAVALGGAAATTGCLDRPVAPAVPKTSNVYVDEIRQTAVDKIDLLFMIDNSISMADKQAILAEAVPILVSRLVTPLCVDGAGTPTQGNADANGMCANGAPEFSPIEDIHVGVITSSLGSHGATGTICVGAEDDDHGRLLGQLRPGLRPYDTNGFLKWDATGGKYNPPGDSNGETFGAKFTEMVQAANENGCGFESSLEAWYRFLIDPEPPLAVRYDAATQKSFVEGVDETVLAQRAAFLRGDSLVAIVMLTDENDCSIQDGVYGHLVAGPGAMYRSTSECLANANDPCCRTCGDTSARQGCGAVADDVECKKGSAYLSRGGAAPEAKLDTANLRCWQQKRRFGFDLLHPTTRYSEGLRSPVVQRRSTGELEQSPLYKPAPGKTARDSGLVFLAGIVGVPWQDIADEASLRGAGLRYLTANELTAQGRWDTILGDPNASPPKLPADPLMVETTEDRTTLAIPQMNPITMDPLVASTSTNPTANPINGHEQVNVKGDDLQYACTFKLATPLTCDEARFAAGRGCDCYADDEPYNRPLCQENGMTTTRQIYAKAYPGLRHLQVLKEYGENSIVASICPKVLDTNSPSYGYNPAVGAIIDRLKEALKGKCLPRPLVPAGASEAGLEVGQVPCKVIEAVLPAAGGCLCDESKNRAEATGELRSAILKKLREGGNCDIAGGTSCDSFCTCELKQLSGSEPGGELHACQNNITEPSAPGYCYVNAAENEPNVGNPELVEQCTADSKRLLRFVGGTPAPGAIALVACLGASLGSAGAN
jgi:hypothetical protein